MRPEFRIVLLAGILILSGSSEQSAITSRQKSNYINTAGSSTIAGLTVKLESGGVSSDGSIQVEITITDGNGRPLDPYGLTTPGKVALNFVAAYIRNGESDYTTYTTRSKAGAATGTTAVQPFADSGGTLEKIGEGRYVYTYATKPTVEHAGATTTLGVWAKRDLSAFGFGLYTSDSIYTFVPNGTAVADLHEEVRTETCDRCHGRLEAHGDGRHSIALCVLCHNPGSDAAEPIDPETGQSLDFKVIVHKIHMGAELPSVHRGQRYVLVAADGAKHDYSNAKFPADPRNCQLCHEGTSSSPVISGDPVAAPGGANFTSNAETPASPLQADYWLTQPTRAACGSCHDNLHFNVGEQHAGQPQLTDERCPECHIPVGRVPFDISVIGSHILPRLTPGLRGVMFRLDKVDDGIAGRRPLVTFGITTADGSPIDIGSMDLLNLVMAGPASNYKLVASEDARGATGRDGTYTYRFKTEIPAGSTGTYTIGIEGYRNAVILPGTVKQQPVRDAGFNRIMNFSVDNRLIEPRDTRIEGERCNRCHYEFTAHGDIRQNVEYCPLCHNGNSAHSGDAATAQGKPMDFAVLVHSVHSGERYPADLRDCLMCHVNGGQELAVALNPYGARAAIAACSNCHRKGAGPGHISLDNSAPPEENCGTCHGPAAQLSVEKAHAH